MNKRIRFRLAGAALVLLAFVLALKSLPGNFWLQPGSPAAGAEQEAGPATEQVPAAVREEPAQAQPAKVLDAVPDPVTLFIDSIGLSVPIVRTGLEKDGSLHVPGPANLTGWYIYGPKPGAAGPAVITGHYDSVSGPGGLFNLKKVKVGEDIGVVRNDGSVAVFKVDSLKYYPQNNFGTKEVYGATSSAGLRIITCAGTYNKKTQRYSDNLVVFATLKEILQPAEYVAK